MNDQLIKDIQARIKEADQMDELFNEIDKELKNDNT
jgi:hypothetical protein